MQLNLLLQFSLFALIRTSPGLFRSFGFVRQQPAFIAFTLFNIVLAPLDEVPLRLVPLYPAIAVSAAVPLSTWCAGHTKRQRPWQRWSAAQAPPLRALSELHPVGRWSAC